MAENATKLTLMLDAQKTDSSKTEGKENSENALLQQFQMKTQQSKSLTSTVDPLKNPVLIQLKALFVKELDSKLTTSIAENALLYNLDDHSKCFLSSTIADSVFDKVLFGGSKMDQKQKDELFRTIITTSLLLAQGGELIIRVDSPVFQEVVNALTIVCQDHMNSEPTSNSKAKL